MKKKFIICSVASVLAMGLSSCDDFLTQSNSYQANDGTFLDSDAAVEATTSPLYNYVWNSFNDKFYYSVGDGRANNITAPWSNYIYPYANFTETSLSNGLEDAWGSLYSVVAQSNNTINRIIDNSGPGVSEAAKVQGIAEARFMRGLAYWYIGSIWNCAILYTNTGEKVNDYVCPPNRVTDVMEFAIRDLEYAAANLSRSATNEGRVTCYSAYGILSRVYLSMAGLTTDGIYDGTNIATDYNRGTRNVYYLNLARKAAEKCIEGPYRLMSDYRDLFKVKTWNNNSESVFQLQWLTGATSAIGWGANNGIATYFGWSTMVCEENWGNATYASFDLVREYDDPKDFAMRRHATIATSGEYYEELNVKNGGYTYNVDESGYDNKCNFKKYVIGKIDDNGISYRQSMGVNTYMMRLAEVYLNLAEAILGNNDRTADETALQYFNAVRERAGVARKSSITWEDLRKERRIELALEGQYWYDLVRRSYYKRNEIVSYLNTQDRNCSYIYDETEKCQYAKNNNGTGVSQATEASLVFPFSDVDLGRNPKLNSAPVAYDFGEREVTHDQLYN